MKSLYKYLCLIGLLFSGNACKKYLDVVPPDVGTLDYAFRSRNEAENYLLHVTMPSRISMTLTEARLHHVFRDYISDEPAG
ncbi:hypothetical protein [Chitinophaga pinensis]|uniref:hypothetical protein n=1 Tax=Chitinophaga pinensis TaxID=79329 RepID=UPI0021BDEA4D|nr:hypothetical protein [Chitinophaga pinensis]